MKKRKTEPASLIAVNDCASTVDAPTPPPPDWITELAREVDLDHITKDEAIEQILQAELRWTGGILAPQGREELEEILREFLDSDGMLRHLRSS